MGVYATVERMKQLVRTRMGTPAVRKVSVNIARDAGSKDGMAQAMAIRDWCEDHTFFIRDPHGMELLHDPILMLQVILRDGDIAVDCDDVALLAATLGKSVGLRARFVVVGFGSPTAPFQHIWTELSSPSGTPQWIHVDVTRYAQDALGSVITRKFITGV
jgi:hypothetical protein